MGLSNPSRCCRHFPALGTRELEPTPAMNFDFDPNRTILGTVFTHAGEESFALSELDRMQHLLVIGKTGMGKTRLLKNIIVQDIHTTSEIVSAFKAVWDFSWGPRMERILYNAIAALIEAENTSLIGLPRLLKDERYREQVLKQVQDPFVRGFFAEEYATWDDDFRTTAIGNKNIGPGPKLSIRSSLRMRRPTKRRRTTASPQTSR
jgi:hypothetical protein